MVQAVALAAAAAQTALGSDRFGSRQPAWLDNNPGRHAVRLPHGCLKDGLAEVTGGAGADFAQPDLPGVCPYCARAATPASCVLRPACAPMRFRSG